MDLLKAFENGKVLGIEKIKKIINTQISKVFLGETKAYKVYKHKAVYIKRLEDESFRREFYKEDFSWNHWMSQEVYLYLRPVTLKDGFFQLVSEDNASDFYIEMSLVDPSLSLSDLLLSNKISPNDIKAIVETFAKRNKDLTNHKIQEVLKISNSWNELYQERIKDLISFTYNQKTISHNLVRSQNYILIIWNYRYLFYFPLLVNVTAKCWNGAP